MSRSRPRSTAVDTTSLLTSVGLRTGDVVRFRRKEGARFTEGILVGREKDGSLSIRDEKGAARALPPDRVEVKSKGPRGGVLWCPADTLEDTPPEGEQLELL